MEKEITKWGVKISNLTLQFKKSFHVQDNWLYVYNFLIFIIFVSITLYVYMQVEDGLVEYWSPGKYNHHLLLTSFDTS